MPKQCIICGKEAKYLIKGTNNYYCEECAEELFGDIEYLQKISEIEDEAKKLRKVINNNLDKNNENL